MKRMHILFQINIFLYDLQFQFYKWQKSAFDQWFLKSCKMEKKQQKMSKLCYVQ